MKLLKTSSVFLGLMILLNGVIYPGIITGIAQLAFPYQANGSLIYQNEQIVGSVLIGQQFDNPMYFWGRLSATPNFPYNALSSAGSNLGPSNPALETRVSERIAALQAADPGNPLPIPVDLITASASGLDSDISVAAAKYQAARVARVRGLPLDRIQSLVTENTIGRTFGLLGEPRVNVLKLNLALDALE
jgi:K+-transporting ATPase ATPase C chain